VNLLILCCFGNSASLHSRNNKLIVSDTGIGLPEDIDPDNTDTLGLTLVMGWVNQLQGEIKIDRTSGTRFQIRFKEL